MLPKVHELYSKGFDGLDRKEADYTEIAKYYEQLAGVELRNKSS